MDNSAALCIWCSICTVHLTHGTVLRLGSLAAPWHHSSCVSIWREQVTAATNLYYNATLCNEIYSSPLLLIAHKKALHNIQIKLKANLYNLFTETWKPPTSMDINNPLNMNKTPVVAVRISCILWGPFKILQKHAVSSSPQSTNKCSWFYKKFARGCHCCSRVCIQDINRIF